MGALLPGGGGQYVRCDRLPFAVREVRPVAADEGGDSIGAGVGGGYAVCRASVASGRGLDSHSWSSSRSSCKILWVASILAWRIVGFSPGMLCASPLSIRLTS